MPDIHFTHPKVDGTLTVQTGANQITWGYSLHTQAFPTYGGEVVQILSAYIDDLTIDGEVGTYNKVEKIYEWFLDYIQNATQPTTESPGFNEEPVQMSYPERNWTLSIQPKGLPGFHLGTEVVVPTWQIQAHVVSADEDMVAVTINEAATNGFNFNRLSAGIGYDEDNPFTNADAVSSPYDLVEASNDLADFYSNLVKSYSEGDFDALYEGYYGSLPAKKGDSPDNANKQDKPSKKETEGTLNSPKGASGKK